MPLQPPAVTTFVAVAVVLFRGLAPATGRERESPRPDVRIDCAEAAC